MTRFPGLWKGPLVLPTDLPPPLHLTGDSQGAERALEVQDLTFWNVLGLLLGKLLRIRLTSLASYLLYGDNDTTSIHSGDVYWAYLILTLHWAVEKCWAGAISEGLRCGSACGSSFPGPVGEGLHREGILEGAALG